MKFLNNMLPQHELTFNDVFMVPSLSDVESRMDVDLTPPDGVGATFPLIVSNMNAVSGRRMAESVARRGGIAILPQDMPDNELKKSIDYVKSCHKIYETPLTLTVNDRLQDALNIIHKRSHGAIVIIDEHKRPIGIFTEKDAVDKDRFAQISDAMTPSVFSFAEGTALGEMHNELSERNLRFAPIVDKKGVLIGAITKKGTVRSKMFTPALDAKGHLMIGAAIGINGDVAAKAARALELGVDVLVVDTAHGHQKKMISALKAVKAINPKVPIVGGNIVTAKAAQELLDAGADILKVGIGPGAMCTTRMMTGVGRPQFSALLECAEVARKAGKQIWADGGVRYPRDVALALAAGSSSVMIGSWLAGTHESVSDAFIDENNLLYKVNFGMASKRATTSRTSEQDKFVVAQKELFQEGISKSRMYIDPEYPGAEDIIDQIAAGVRSSMTYAGARNIDEFHKKAIVGIQSNAGFAEGKALDSSWS
ncbi:GuaB1 family IMP dehydrogenase-related protein [Candidatus Saccharibacteria bacterium]|nr:GuaB1 family IMP dehydrogenase-related protein [Candidatus Saccharibacteria bacterium]